MKLDSTFLNSLDSESRITKVTRIMEASLTAVDPHRAVINSLDKIGFCHKARLDQYKVSRYRQIKVIGAGKAGQPMAAAIQDCFGERIKGGAVIVKDGYTNEASPTQLIKILEARHPIPDQRSVVATQEIIDLIEGSRQDDLIICLISGGGSALLTAPVHGVSLDEIQKTTELLLASGATINEINTLRKHLDQVKGGQLARIASPASVLCLILSDVIADPLDVIASGPTVPDPTTFQQALDILDRYGLCGQVPIAIEKYLNHGRKGKAPETPKSGEEFFSKVENHIVGNNHTATRAAVAQAEKEGFHTLTLTNFLQGEASQAGIFLSSVVHQMALRDQPVPRPGFVVVGGETTVTLEGNGLGGRNQEIALAAVSGLDGLQDVALVTLATDGGDGPTDAAGAVVTGSTNQRARELGLHPEEFLDNHDSYNFFSPLGDLIKIGPTRTNVNDLAFLFAY